MSKKVYLKDWLKYKPYDRHSNEDTQYLEIANKINKVLLKVSFLKNQIHLSEEDIVELSVFLTCYLEDLVSDTNVWNTFISIHKEKYNKHLPFYNTTNYLEGEVNHIDIKFLIWYFLNLKNLERFLSPFDGYLDYLAEDIFEILNFEFDYVDENERLKDYFTLPPNSDYYQTRRLMQFVLFESYLLKIDAGDKLSKKILELLSEYGDTNGEFLNQMVYSNTDSISNSYSTKLLAMKGKNWLAAIIGSDHQLYNAIQNISDKISSFFLYKGENKKCIHFQHIASDVIFDLTKESFNANFDLSEDKIYYLEMVFWNKEWTFSGISFVKDFDADLILDEKNDMLKINLGTQFDKQIQKESKGAVESQGASFIKIFNSPILFIEEKDLQLTLDKFMNSYNQSLSKDEEDHKQKLEESKQRHREKGFFAEDSKIDSFEKGDCVVYYNPNSGIEMFNNICSIFPDKNNPFYEGEDEDEIKMFLFSPIYSKELTEYFIEKYASTFDYFKTGTGEKYLKDFDFLLRFWKNEMYYSKPSITHL